MRVVRHEMPGNVSRKPRPGRARSDRLALYSRAVERAGALLDQTVPYGTDTNAGFPGISCLATIVVIPTGQYAQARLLRCPLCVHLHNPPV
jgi:hypothetical protein